MISPLQDLSLLDLHNLGEAIRAGRLYPPFTRASIQRYCSGSNVETIASELQRLTDDGTTTDHIAFLLEILADDRSGRSKPDDLIDLVLTGPEAPGIASRDTSVVVRELFSSATEYVLVAGYAIYQGRQVFHTLADRMVELPDLKVEMFLDVQRRHGDTTKDSEILREFAHRFKRKEWPGDRLPKVYYDPRSLETEKIKRSSLHAKCVVIDDKIAFVSSANFTEAAQIRNIEVGVVIRSAYFSSKLSSHFEALADIGTLRPLPGI